MNTVGKEEVPKQKNCDIQVGAIFYSSLGAGVVLSKEKILIIQRKANGGFMAMNIDNLPPDARPLREKEVSLLVKEIGLMLRCARLTCEPVGSRLE